jgi:hypothetical protein
MRPTGRRSSTETHRPARYLGRRFLPPALAVLVVLSGSGPAAALDIFTLWRQPQVPLRLEVGTWAEYKSSSTAGGRRSEDYLRIQCLARPDGRGGATDSWLLEIVPISDGEAGNRRPQPGEGVHLRLTAAVLARHGDLLDAVVSVTRWRQGAVTRLTAAEWREDPLVADTFGHEFHADKVEAKQAAVRVIGKQDLNCQQFVFTAEDTQTVRIPAGSLVQVTTAEVTAAVNPEIPFLGLAFVAERVRAESRLDPPSARFSPPAPQASVQTLECIGFGKDARPVLEGLD